MIMTGDGNILNDDGSSVTEHDVLFNTLNKFIYGTVSDNLTIYVYDGECYSFYSLNHFYIPYIVP